MPELICQVLNCQFNNNSYCRNNEILVDDKKRCLDFIEKSYRVFYEETSIFDIDLLDKTVVLCKAFSCKNNKFGKCRLKILSIRHSSKKIKNDTICDSYEAV